MNVTFIFWTILLLLIFLLILVIVLVENKPTEKEKGYLAISSLDGQILNRCGKDQNLPCMFTMNTLNSALNHCTELSQICNSFSYDGSTMKILQENTTFANNQTSFFKKVSI